MQNRKKIAIQKNKTENYQKSLNLLKILIHQENISFPETIHLKIRQSENIIPEFIKFQ